MKKQRILFFFVFFFILMTLALAADDPQDLKQQEQQRWSIRSLLQAPPKIDCPSSCVVRCGDNWKNQMCNKMCNVCCNRCSCVPPGTGQDTRHLCPCYDTMVNPHTGKLKCP
ncbi:gibberellin-regulated protein 2-like [Panicum miliaceum]|uniref:Gibberellin-regulated protein 2-like n=1 Tax=Panicum miliaceum TaxID=4540 RepID=A0A3L6S1N7_PANMI|nr:gibberellin-regulated protein 2-like [Panicum miliaceum]